MIYKLSVTALRQYRAGAKKDKNLPKDILEIKINCLIMSVDAINTRYTVCGKIYQFGRCQFEVDRENRVRNICWKGGNQVLRSELRKLKENYKSYGLNEDGNNYLERR